MKLFTTSSKIISINDLRRNFGEVEKALPFVDRFIVTKKGKPLAVLSAAPDVKRALMRKTAGVFRGGKLDKDDLWREVLKKKSRRENITL